VTQLQRKLPQAYAAEMKAAKAAPKLRCDEYKMDKKGKCPGDTGYVSFVKDNVPKDFAVSRSEYLRSTEHSCS
jgi:hypothetical protein